MVAELARVEAVQRPNIAREEMIYPVVVGAEEFVCFSLSFAQSR